MKATPPSINTGVPLGIQRQPRGCRHFTRTWGSGRAHPVSRRPLVSPGAAGPGCVTRWPRAAHGRGRRRWRARRARCFCPSGCCCLCCPFWCGRLPAPGQACRTRRAAEEAVKGPMGGHGAPSPRAALKTRGGQSHPSSNVSAVPSSHPRATRHWSGCLQPFSSA